MIAGKLWRRGLVVALVVGLAGTGAAAEAGAGVRKPAKAGDVNGDGRVDVIAGVHLLKAKGRSDAGGVAVYLGGARKVSGVARVVTLGRTMSGENLGRVLATGDFDRDGYADVLASAREKLVVFRGSRSGLRGTGARVMSWPVTAPAMAAADFDGDGYWDVAVAGVRQVVVLRGSRTGLRTGQRLADGAPGFGARLAAGDVTGDGRPDLVVTEDRPTPADPVETRRITVVPGARAGLSMRAAWSIGPVERAARDLAVGDVDGDRRADLVRVTATEADEPVFRVVVQLSRGNGFGAARELRYDSSPSNVALGDVTGDGRADLAVHLATDGDHDRAVLHAGTAAGVSARPIREFEHATYETRYGTTLRLADVRGDSRADVVAGLPGVYGTGELEVLPGGRREGAQRLRLTGQSGLGWSQPS
ncbi:FG-GAP repeat domain-containing protein [Sphaerisporangium aureirubrum]|uniref:FG-GAP repeat domain-containing protein n=1 Tax=Sphaerisporangium aureirubrum TaxID=1544736 RepID=A0ABW1NVA3_9ACTN